MDIDVYNLARSSVIIALAFTLIGCGQQPETARVAGAFEWKGKPVYPGTVIMTNEAGDSYTGNLNSEGAFVLQVEELGDYTASIQVQNLGGRRSPPRSEQGDSDEPPTRREDTIPEQFRNANTDIPSKYSSSKTSELTFEIRQKEVDLGRIELE